MNSLGLSFAFVQVTRPEMTVSQSKNYSFLGIDVFITALIQGI